MQQDALPPHRRPQIMGIVNVTPDSFADGGRFDTPAAAIEHAVRLADEGADIIDVGGESTRPPGTDYGEGASAVPTAEEIRRVVPVIAGLRALRPDVVISVDTMKPDVASAAADAGASIVNDVSAGRYDASIMNVAADRGLAYIVMHGHDPHHRTTIDEAQDGDIVAEVFAFLRERIAAAREAGVERIIADVGIGFAKGAARSEALLRRHDRFLDLGVPLLVGASRKAFIGRALGGLPASERLFGTLAAHAVAVANGASIVRVHDVRAAREFFTVFERLRSPAA